MTSPLDLDANDGGDAPLDESVEARNAWLNARAHRFDGGYIRWYSGVPRPHPGAPIENQLLLSESQFGTPAFGPAANGEIVTLTPPKPLPPKGLYGAPTWIAFVEADGGTPIGDTTLDENPDARLLPREDCRCHLPHPHPARAMPPVQVIAPGEIIRVADMAITRPTSSSEDPAAMRWAE